MKFNQFSSNKIHFSYFSLNPLCHDLPRAPLINNFSYFHSHPQQKLYSIFHIPKKKFYFFLLSFPLLSLLVTTTFLIFLFSKIEKKIMMRNIISALWGSYGFLPTEQNAKLNETERHREFRMCVDGKWKISQWSTTCVKKKRKKKLQLDLWAKMNRFGSWWRHR